MDKSIYRRISFFGAPGFRKSTWAMATTVRLSEFGFNAGLVTEHCKDLVLRGYKQPEPIDQLHIAANQLEREITALRNYPIIVTDSPLHLACVFCRYYGGSSRLIEAIRTTITILDEEYPSLNILLDKPSNYDSNGRWQNESQSDEVQSLIVEYLDRNKIPYMHASTIDDVVKNISDAS